MCLLAVGWMPASSPIGSRAGLLTNTDYPIVGHGCTMIGLGQDVSELVEL